VAAAGRASEGRAAAVVIDTVPLAFSLVAAAAFGAIVGSFLNVVIHRVPLGASIAWPSSACPHCKRELSWYENIPVVSYLVLRARCRTCKAPISIRYPFVEALTSVMFVLAWWAYGPGVLFASRVVFGCTLIALFAIDFEHQLLPHVITLGGVTVGFIFSFFAEPGWVDSLLGIAAGAGILYAVAFAWERWRHQEALGGGDPPMLAMIGAFLGWKMVLATLMMGSLFGSVLGLGLIAARRASMASKLPFGCFLAVGAALSATVGPQLLGWYLGLF
jgi:leader peptidase (prepilin peptidase)/N-methyltransferase